VHHSFVRQLLCLLSYLLLISAQDLFAGDQPRSLQDLSRDSTWLKLLHYEPKGFPQARPQSAIISPEFFLSPTGNQDPLAELMATVSALQLAIPPEGDTHAICRFPARALWLKAQMSNELALVTDIPCPELDKWTRSNSISSISVIFATGYLGNPASYYGHTLLKFNFKDEQSQGSLMDVSLNYGAIVDGNDDPATYILKGIFGGYDGGFSHINFYFHNHNYGENELRDMWEYQLALPQAAVDLVAAHAWEVLGKRYTYYFFRRNCAFRMAEILDVVDGLSIVPERRPWTIPQSLIQNLAKSDFKGSPLLTDIKYHPSRQSRLYNKYQELGASEQTLFKRLALKEDDLSDLSFTQSPLARQQRVLDTLLDYYQFVRDRESGADDPANLAHRQALAMRYQLPPGIPTPGVARPVSPHSGRSPSWFQLGLVQSSDLSNNLSVRVRPAYYDALDADHAHIKRAGLSMGDLRLHISDSGIRLRQLDIISISSVSPGLTGLPGDTAGAWNLKLGVEPLRLDCTHCLVPRVQADRGYGYRLNNNLFAAAYIGAALQENRLQEGHGFARLSARLDLDVDPLWNAQLQVEHRLPESGRISAYNTVRFEARRRLGNSQDLRISYERNRGEELSIALGWYW
jgi:hypothetical protein